MGMVSATISTFLAGATTGGSATATTGAGMGAGGAGARVGVVVTDVGGAVAAAAGCGTAMVGANVTRAGALGGGRKTTRALCGVIALTPGGGFKTIRPVVVLVLGIRRRGTVAIGAMSSSTPRFRLTPCEL
tara:strand:- start:1090 stop:1482 length:393 start_codon:yes stop_codon:yes gene_type:complete